jgi:outer membrane protein assembly factor BamD (BamD/ComL family)
MSTSTTLSLGLEALEQGRYGEAVELLEEFCQSAEVDTDRLQAQKSLVTAYNSNNQAEKAIALCQQLLVSDNSEIKAWARQSIVFLQPQYPNFVSGQEPVNPLPGEVASEFVMPVYSEGELTPEQAEELLNAGIKALKQECYAEAVQALTTYCQKVDPAVKAHGQAQILLVKAYKGNGQLDEAIALCHTLATSNKQMVQVWAKQFIDTLVSVQVIPSLIEPILEETRSTVDSINSNVPLKKRTIQEFKTFCQKNLLGELRGLETKRKQILVNIAVASMIIFGVLGSFIHFFPYSIIKFGSRTETRLSLLVILVFMFICVSCMWGWVIFYTSSTETYASGFKANFIQKIIGFIDTNETFNYSYDEDKHSTLLAFRASNLFQGLLSPTKISQADCISGQVGETSIFFSEICTEAELNHSWVKHLDILEYADLTQHNFIIILPIYILSLTIKSIKSIPYIIFRIVKGQRINYQHFEQEVIQNQVSRKKIFKGLFFRANFNKNFKGRTVVLPSDLTSKLKSLTQGRGAVVRLEDPEFAKLFVVFGDQIEARFILSTSLIERIVNFRKKAGRKIYISFAESNIYIAIEYEEDIFEPRLFKTMLRFAPIREYFESLQLMIGIIEDLNLNRRIWN